MKIAFLIPILFFLPISAMSQNNDNFNLLEADSTWSKEIFQFPIHFAPEINFEGFEDARFPEGWGKQESPFFWSYVFAWKINMAKEPDEKELQDYLQLYFDGLMNVVNKDPGIMIPKTTAFVHKIDTTNGKSRYRGKITMYDAFRTKELITLHLLVEHYECKQKTNSLLVFRFSPKDFDNEVWQTLKRIDLKENSCDI